jgi:hypothetical protein
LTARLIGNVCRAVYEALSGSLDFANNDDNIDTHLRRSCGCVLFIDEAYYLYHPENVRDYGLEAIEILLQVMENQGNDMVVIRAAFLDRIDWLLLRASRVFT